MNRHGTNTISGTMPHAGILKRIAATAITVPAKWPRCWCGKRVRPNKNTGEPTVACSYYHTKVKAKPEHKNSDRRKGCRGNYRDAYEARALMGCL